MKEHLLSYDIFSEADIARILPHFKQKTFAKKELIIRNGEVAKQVYFIVKGCIRAFLIDYNGKEHTILFGTEGYWMGDLQAFTSQSYSSYNYQALEPTEVLAINKTSWDHLMNQEPNFIKYVGLLFRNALIVQQERLVEIFSLPAEERYQHLLEKRKDLLNRVSQKHIASYIGITPEFLSQIRKKAAEG